MVTVFGLGFVGLTTALGFAHLGYDVYGIDVDETRTEILRNGKLPFLEPEMEHVLQKHLNHNFFITDDIPKAVTNSNYIFYCVGTPYGKNGCADLTYLFSAMESALAAIKDETFRVLVIKSTIPPSTTAEKILPFIESKKTASQRLGIANNPEFLREGHCWEDFTGADRIILGCNDNQSQEMLIRLYEPLGIPIKCVSQSTGEFIKYLSNTLLATLISYSNEMSEIADAIGGIDVADAFHILHMDKRWNGCDMTSYVYPGCGYGGYCLPKDTAALYAQAAAKGMRPPILKHVIETNHHRASVIAKKISSGMPKNSAIGILGLSFKPLSDDVRDTPAARIINELRTLGYHNIYAYDPVAMDEFHKHYPEILIQPAESAHALYNVSDVVAIVTAWEEFREIPSYGSKKIVDCRYMLDKA